MLHTLSTPTVDIEGYVELRVRDDQPPGEARRRVTRAATLDGGAVMNDFGFTDADRTIELSWRPTTPGHEASVLRLVELYGRLHVSTRAGVFLAAPESYRQGADESRLRLLVLSKISA